MAHPSTIGRFNILRVLGEGAQSVVYLAEDPHLQREVAIKTVHLGEGGDHARRTQALIAEARAVSKLQHPNIVPIFEAGEHEGNPYLVFEHVAGSDLARLIRNEGALPARRAAELLVPVLDAVAHAHRHGIIHRDLKPSNILLTADGVPRVMDFGIAARLSDAPGTEHMLFGTPSYMAPEYIGGGEIGPGLDIFASGMVLHQMLTGVPAVQGADARETLRLILREPIAPPSARNGQVDEKMDDIVLKALAKDPASRYASAHDMRAALLAYLNPEETPAGTPSNQGTLDFLLRRMRHKSDFPALSESIGAINRITSSESESVNQLSSAILRDVALTSKLLKVVNAAYYTQYGGGAISTVSRAVVTLGFDAVRNIALTLMLFDHLQNQEHAALLKDQFVRSLHSALIAKSLAAKVGVRNAEEGFICALFHNLGKLLCMFYLLDEVEEVERVMAQKHITEERASLAVLGMSYQDIGIGVTRAWNFPELIVHSMRALPEHLRKPANDLERLNLLAAFAHDISRMTDLEAGQEKSRELLRLAQRFGTALGVGERAIRAVAEDAATDFARFAGTLQLDLRESAAGKRLLQTARQPETTDAAPPGTADDEQTRKIALAPGGLRQDALGILTQGIQDISNSLVEGRSLNDIMRMILETMYSAIGFSHALLCLKDARQNAMVARSGFGPETARIIPSFKFPMAFAPDVFHASLKNNVDIIIEDIDDPGIRARIPEWYRRTIPAHTFVLFPVVLKNNPVALIYADKPGAGDIRLSEQELGLLRVLRNQAVLAIKTHS